MYTTIDNGSHGHHDEYGARGYKHVGHPQGQGRYIAGAMDRQRLRRAKGQGDESQHSHATGHGHTDAALGHTVDHPLVGAGAVLPDGHPHRGAHGPYPQQLDKGDEQRGEQRGTERGVGLIGGGIPY